MPVPLPVLLLLDIASDNPIAEDELLTHIPEQERSNLLTIRATEHGATKSRRGTPEDFRPCADAIVKMVEHARSAADDAGTTPCFYVAGRAALPLFALLGNELSGWADVTFLNRRRDPPVWDVLRLGRGARAFSKDEKFFVEHTGMDAVNEAEGRVSVIISTAPPRQETESVLFMALQGEPQAGGIRLSAHTWTDGRPIRGDLDETNVTRAAYEIEQAFGSLPAVFPNRRGLSVFIDGPASLAFLVGRALNPNLLRHPAWVPNYNGMEGGGYYPAVILPHRSRSRAAGPDTAVSVVVLHASTDDGFLQSFKTCLAPLIRNGTARIWHRGMIEPGQNKDEELQAHLEDARIVVALLSGDLVAEDRLLSHIERIQRFQRATKTIPVAVRDFYLPGTPFADLQVLPRSGKAIAAVGNRDAAWKDIQEELFRLLRETKDADPGDKGVRS